MYIFDKNNLNSNFLNIFLGLIPVSYIFGNLLLNLNILILFLFAFYRYKFDLFKIKKNTFNYLLIFFFFYLIITTYFNNFRLFNQNELYFENFIKSILFLRYLLLFLIINKLAEKRDLDLKYLFFLSGISLFLLILDIYFQSIFGFDVFGNIPSQKRLSGFFGDELIAGGYIQIFSFFLIFLTPTIIFVNKKKYFKIFFIIVTIFVFLGILLTNNRMPLLLFLFTLGIFLMMENKLRKYFIVLVIALSLIFLTVFKINPKVFNKYDAFLNYINIIAVDTYSVFTGKIETFVYKKEGYLRSDHLRLFYTAINLSKENIIFGNGLKSFRLKCKIKDNYNYSCSNHPHNYFIELLLDTGLIGLLSIASLFLIAIYKFLKIYLGKKGGLLNRVIFAPPFLTLCSIAFPIKSSGSFFTTNVAIITFMMLALVINTNNLKITRF